MSATTEGLRLALEPPAIGRKHGLGGGQPVTPLSERLRRLWTERGDFSQFTLADLRDETDKGNKEQKSIGGDDRPLQIDFGSEGEEALEKAAAGLARNQGETDATSGAKDIDTSAMTMEEFVSLKEQMMGRLQ